jgi:hypothetical protein
MSVFQLVPVVGDGLRAADHLEVPAAAGYASTFCGKLACTNGVVTNARDPRVVIQASGLYDAR